MGKSHEALEWAEKEYLDSHRETLPVPLPKGPALPSRRRWTLLPPAKPYQDLKTNLLNRYRDGSVKSVLFVGTTGGDGASTAAANFAIALAMDSRVKVLLIDANLKTPRLHTAFKIDPIPGLTDLLTRNGRGPRPVKVGPGNLRIIPCGRPYAEQHALFESHKFEEFLRRMREKHDYVIFDGPPIHGSSECRVLCAKVDGVVLVIESGKTRRQVAVSAKKQLVEAGGRVLGVVLNKRRFYIPESIYRWL